MQKNLKEQCKGCVYAQYPFHCDNCVHWYGEYPDRFLDEEVYFDVGEDLSERAEKWPDNLYCAVLGISPDQYTRRPKNLERNIEKVLSFLMDRERDILLMRYKENASLKEIKVVVGISVERIRQVRAQAVRKLRMPSLRQLLMFGCGVSQLRDFDADALQSENAPLEASSLLFSSKDSIRGLNLNFRVFGALSRSGLFTIPQISGMSDSEILNIPGIGKKGAKELRIALDRYFSEVETEEVSDS